MTPEESHVYRKMIFAIFPLAQAFACASHAKVLLLKVALSRGEGLVQSGLVNAAFSPRRMCHPASAF